MANLWKDILVPLAIAGGVVAQTLGVDMHRAAKVRDHFPAVPLVRQDTLPKIDTLLALKDSLAARDTLLAPKDTLAPKDSLKAPGDSLKAPGDSLSNDEDFDLFAELEDTLPKVYARDTMKVPDSLRLTDPFLFQWYVATKDSYTHRLVVDSLKAEGDSLLWPRIDSLFLADSTAAAKAAWERTWAGMTKAERKRWTYENVTYPAIRHRQDSVRHVKDSLKARRDSIIQTTPRILETSFLPDSLLYKRLVTWKRNRLYNSIETFEWDTTANYHFYDYPFMREDVGATWLGMPGAPVQQYNYFRRGKEQSPSFYESIESWTYSADNFTFFNTKTPYTELSYTGTLLDASTTTFDNFRVFTTQNILPSLNITLEMKRYGGSGILMHEKTGNNTYMVGANYTGRKYLAHLGFVSNKLTREESGGIQDNMWIRDTTVDVREISVHLANAATRTRKLSVFLDQSYRIPFEFIEALKHRGDSTWVKPDTVNTNITTGFIGTSSEFTVYSRKYQDVTSSDLASFYNQQFNINPNQSSDSLRTMRLDNRIFVRIQPWKEDAIVSKVEGGIGDRFQTFYLQRPDEVLYKPANRSWNSLYAYAGVEGRWKKYLEWDATAMYNFAGAEVNDFSVNANAAFSFYPFRRQRNSPITLKAHFETALKEPDFYQQHFYTNHFKWENDFSKTSTTKIQAFLDIPRWKLKAEVGYGLLANYVYYDTLGIVRQHKDPMSVLTAGLSHHLALGPVHLENSALFQVSSNQAVLPLPMLALNLRWYLQFNIVDPKVLQLQAGVNTRLTTKWYMPAYNPVTGTFMNQNEEQYGLCPVFDIFLNLQWKKCCIFLKYENIGKGWPATSHDYFSAHHYIQRAGGFKFGIYWPLYPRLGAAKTLSARAGAGVGGGGLSGGALGGLKGAINSGR